MPNRLWGQHPYRRELEIAVRTRKQRYSGGPESQVLPVRSRPDAPANTRQHGDQNMDRIGNASGVRNVREQRVQEQPITPPQQSDTYHEEETHSGASENRAQEPREINTGTRQKWTKDEYKEVMWCYYYSKNTDKTYKEAFNIWRERNTNSRPNMDANKLQNQRRHIELSKRLSEEELKEISEAVISYIQEENRNKIINVIPETELLDQEETARPTEEEETERIIMEEVKELINKYKFKEIMDRKKLPKVGYRKETFRLVNIGNAVLDKILEEEVNPNLKLINTAIYCTAYIITEKANKLSIENLSSKSKRKTQNIPSWQRRLETKIENLRKDVSQLTAIRNGHQIKSRKSLQNLTKKYLVDPRVHIEEAIEMLKQKISATSQRLRRYKARTQQFFDNKLFNTNTKAFYRKLREKEELLEPPKVEEVEKYWENIYGDDTTHNTEAEWIGKIKENHRNKEMLWKQIVSEEITERTRKTQNWKSTGFDMIPNYWLKNLTTSHKYLAEEYNSYINNPESIPDWLAVGKTYLIFKKGESANPKNYRPITCLNTIYKNFTSILASRITKYVHNEKIIPTEQRGCMAGTLGCKDHLIFAKRMLEDCSGNKKNLHLAWIDYQKAYDSVPHSWLIESLKIYGIAPELIGMLKHLMSTWKIKMFLQSPHGEKETRTLDIKRGIYQGDSLSPIWFCMAMAPLSTLINRTSVGYKLTDTNHSITHQLYMDDLKLICKSNAELNRAMQVVQTFSSDIQMTFGIEKCATATFIKGKLKYTDNLKLNEEEEIKALNPEQTYKYLGIEEGQGIDHPKMKEQLKKEYITRVRKLLQTHLNCKNTFQAIGTLAVPVISYSFGIVDWTLEEIQKLDRKTRKLLTMNGLLHPRQNVARLYVKRKAGGRGLQQLESSYYSTIFSLSTYIRKNCHRDPIVENIKKYEMSLPTNKSILKKSRKIEEKINKPITENQGEESISNEEETEGNTLIQERSPESFKQKCHQNLLDTWHSKPLHGQKIRDMNKIKHNKCQSYKWLSSGTLKGETESLLTAAQEQAIKTRYLSQRTHRSNIDPSCRICKKELETIHHIMSACGILAKKEYLDRHNKVCTLLHYNICKYYNCQDLNNKWYKHIPQKVTKSSDEQTTILYDMPIQTDREVQANRPDIVIRTKNMTYLLDVSVPSDEKITEKTAEKLLKYKNLEIEIKRMWHTKTTILPVIIGVTGFVDEEYIKFIQKIPGEHDPLEIQKTAIIGTAHIIRKVLT